MGNWSGRGRAVTQADLAQLFGVSVPTVQNWVRNGCPFVERGGKSKAWTFNTAEVAAWREQRVRDDASGVASASEAELRRRKLAAETGTAELDYARARAEVAPVEQFEKALVKVFAEVRAQLRVIPSRVSRMIVGSTDESHIKGVLIAEIDQALEALANADLLSDEDLEDDGEHE
ncbi:terminase small subunit [Cereibacter sphaeroides]|uniref:terminase small subunit n=1 Tax=Cereibacter sphaeroides TaxID=1063 RepID=UPI001E428B49|nr:terminase small subunit [Cereibacter sphaeroides]